MVSNFDSIQKMIWNQVEHLECVVYFHRWDLQLLKQLNLLSTENLNQQELLPCRQ